MRAKRTLVAVAAAAISCLIVVWCTTAIQGSETYEIHPHVAVPYGYTPATDTYRLIDLIEYLTDQNQQIAIEHLSAISEQLKALDEKLSSVDAKLTRLSRRMTRIEEALDIQQPPPTTGQKSAAESPPAVSD
ncbi:MAG: hypothetical protein JSW23_00575 [Planctomycetota bacterium]|nr:MAG: hypothetical protein JSW23_00575 [Planctomycetota bacterium]